MSLRARLLAHSGEFELDVELEAGAGELVAIVGPNGAGKTTLLRVLAGLLAVSAGSVTLDSEVLDDPLRGTFVAAEHRRIGVVFQSYLLFGHMSAADNIAFGLRARGWRRAAARTEALRWLEAVELADHADARPAALSGGQAQRVAIARALATRPRLLLLDEPLAALDVHARSQLRDQLARHLSSFDGIRLLVTHDPRDAAALADRMVVVEAGRVVQAGSVAEVAASPRSRYVAEFMALEARRS